mmetsp:Transcript_52011/g.71383  ORF Transcript_52011/g.71383 Transcript_52011/m.71383 type:complete len:177 (-) Transcript_52011:1458-1988(-)
MNPLLIRGTKWDMRIYVLVTNLRPLKLWLYREGIVRFSSERYDLKSVGNIYSHLTNSSINKGAPNMIRGSGAYGNGLKWSFDQMRSYFRDCGYSWDLMWVKIEIMIMLTAITLCNTVPDMDCCIELFGFDVIIDANLRPWLLECNSSPAMSMDCNIDSIVKPALLKDTINICNLVP